MASADFDHGFQDKYTSTERPSTQSISQTRSANRDRAPSSSSRSTRLARCVITFTLFHIFHLPNVYLLAQSCGYAVPFYDFISHRSTLENELALFERRENDGTGKGLRQYWREWNTYSLDGLPGLLSAYDTVGELKNVGIPNYGQKEGANGSARSGNGKVRKEGNRGTTALSHFTDKNYLLGAMTGALAVLACSRVVAGK